MDAARRLKDQYWLIPAVICTAAVVSAELLLMAGDGAGFVGPPWLLTPSPAAARDLMAVIAGSLLTATATMFSITIAVIVLTSSVFGARLVRNFMNDRGSQTVLGMFLGSFLYALIVLRGIGDREVPVLAVNVAVYLTVVDVALLVYYVQHITNAIQLGTLSSRLKAEFQSVISAVYGDSLHRRVADPPPSAAAAATRMVRAQDHGYVAQHDVAELLDIAAAHGCSIEVLVQVGHHVVDGETIATLRWAGPLGEGQETVAAERLRRALVLSAARTPVQDVDLAAAQLRELLVRALPPGVSDPQTALNALDDLTVGLLLLAPYPPPSRRVMQTAEGGPTVMVPQRTLQELLQLLFCDVRGHGTGEPELLRQLLHLAVLLAERTNDPALPSFLAEQVRDLQVAVEHDDPNPVDLRLFREEAAQVLERLTQGARGDGAH